MWPRVLFCAATFPDDGPVKLEACRSFVNVNIKVCAVFG